MTERAVFPPGDAKEDWAIIRALSAEAGHDAALRHARRVAGGDVQVGAAARAPWHAWRRRPTRTARRARQDQRFDRLRSRSSRPIRDFYLTNPIARASAVMAEMSALKKTVSASPRLKAAE